MPKNPKIDLSEDEEKIVKEFEEGFLELERIHKDDPRGELYHEILMHRHKKHDIDTERLNPVPDWNLVFKEGYCPSCNTAEEISRDTAKHKIHPGTEQYVCDNCGFRVSKELFEKSKQREEEYQKWLDEDEMLAERLSRMGGTKRERLAKLGEERAYRRIQELEKKEL